LKEGEAEIPFKSTSLGAKKAVKHGLKVVSMVLVDSSSAVAMSSSRADRLEGTFAVSAGKRRVWR
jgi:hypothetical protein